MIIRVITSTENRDFIVEDAIIAEFMYNSMRKNAEEADEMFNGSLCRVELLNSYEEVLETADF